MRAAAWHCRRVPLAPPVLCRGATFRLVQQCLPVRSSIPSAGNELSKIKRSRCARKGTLRQPAAQRSLFHTSLRPPIRPGGTLDSSPAIHRWAYGESDRLFRPGRTAEWPAFGRPYGTCWGRLKRSGDPAVNCWATIKRPYGAGTPGTRRVPLAACPPCATGFASASRGATAGLPSSVPLCNASRPLATNFRRSNVSTVHERARLDKPAKAANSLTAGSATCRPEYPRLTIASAQPSRPPSPSASARGRANQDVIAFLCKVMVMGQDVCDPLACPSRSWTSNPSDCTPCRASWKTGPRRAEKTPATAPQPSRLGWRESR